MELVGCDVSVDQFYKGKLQKGGLYDLEATSLSATPVSVSVGDEVRFTYKVTNVGKEDVPHGNYQIDLYVGKELVAYDHGTSTIKRGLDVEYSMSSTGCHWKPTAKGIYEVRFVVDERNDLPETDEANNIASLNITVK